MKKLLLLFAILVFANSGNAQKVALHSATGVQHFTGHTGFAEACTSAVSGDTIYLPGGGFSPPGTIDKQLLIFGAGHYPDSTLATSKTIINGSITLSENADGFHIEGVDIVGNFTTSANHSVNHIKIKYCRIQGQLIFPGDQTNPVMNLIMISSAVGGNVSLSNAQNAGIFNSFFNGLITGTNGNLFKNNIHFYNQSSSTSIITGNNNILENNIFLRTSYTEINGYSNIVKNNISPKTNPSWGTTPIESDNYVGVLLTDIFVNQEGNVFDYAHDYHLQAPETYLGTDGTQVGIYGGLFPYKEGAVPSNPHIYMKNISAQTNEQGELPIQIGVEAQNR